MSSTSDDAVMDALFDRVFNGTFIDDALPAHSIFDGLLPDDTPQDDEGVVQLTHALVASFGTITSLDEAREKLAQELVNLKRHYREREDMAKLRANYTAQ